MSQYITSDSAFLNTATYLANACVVPHKPSCPVPVKFQGKQESIPIYRAGFKRLADDEKGRQSWELSFYTTLIMPKKTWEGIQKSPEQPRNVTLLGTFDKKIYNTDFRIFLYELESELQGDLVAVHIEAASLFQFLTYGFGDIDAEIAEIVKRGNEVPANGC
ncbi:MAG: hypothetical protein WC052_06140 [Patescibacteria group bacterium]